MKKLFLMCIIVSTTFMFAFAGCSLKGILPSDCDDVVEQSFLCDLADRFDTRIEDIGNGLIVINSVLIGEGVYSKEQALEVASGMKTFLKDPVSWLDFGNELKKRTEKYPGLYDISELYIAEFSKSTLSVGSFDKEHLIGFFEKVEKILLK